MIGTLFRLLVCAICVLPASHVHAQITAVPVTEPVRLDGRLDEHFWDSIEPLSAFTQRELTEGAPPSERTEIRIAYDHDHLYLGIRCFDAAPERIIHKQLKHDGDMDGDDHISFVIDTYNDRRTGFLFTLNPNGARAEASFPAGGSVNTNWDIIWDVAAWIDDAGWIAEVMIPFKSLRFPEREIQTWAVDFQRTIRRKNEEVLWRGWGRNDGVRQLSKAGTLVIRRQLQRSRQLDLAPFLLGGVEKERGADPDDTFRYGLDVNYGITSNTSLDLTFKTDFAQIESDREVINLTRFDITYPEKRDFFLNGSDLFDFTQGGTRLFYSRQIGISPDRQEVPILAGAKLMQKTGDFRLGVMNMQTEDAHGLPATNYTVARVRKDVLAQSYVGAIITNRMDTDDYSNQAYGIDFGYLTDRFLGNRNLNIQGYLAGTVTNGEADDTMAGRVYLNSTNDVVATYLLYHQINPGFDPDVGFVRRTGIKNSIWNLKITPRVDWPHIKKILTQPVYINYTTDMDNRLIDRAMEFRPFGLETDAGDSFVMNYRNSYDYVDEDFTLFKDTVITRGTYDWWFYLLVFRSSPARRVSGMVASKFGDYYNGTWRNLQGSLTYKTGSHLGVSGDFVFNRIAFGGDEFTTREYGIRLTGDVSTSLGGSTFIQYNNATEQMNVNVRIHWISRVGNDLYIVYNHLLDEDDETSFTTLQQAAMLKAAWTYRF